MASLIRDPGGKKRVLVNVRGIRRTIRLGEMDVKSAEALLGRVETLAVALHAGTHPDPATSQWLGTIDDRLHGRLVKAGLAEPRATQRATLESLFDAFFSALAVKSGTRVTYEQTRRSLEDFFGARTELTRVTALEAERWRTWLREDQKLAGATIAKRVKTARQAFKRAVKWKMVADNPFDDVRTGSQSNPARMHYVDRETTEKVLAACPDLQWRLIFALARYGGLRCPSEVLTLRWGDIQWDADRFTVWSCKTEGYEGREYRHVPLFPELRPLLEEAFERAEEGSEYVVTRYRGSETNLRTTLLKILARAGVPSWPKLFQNLRSSRATELCNDHPAHVVAAWMGHTVTVAQKHYLQVRDCDFERAAGRGARPAGGGATPNVTSRQNPGKAAQKAAQSGAVLARTASQAGAGRFAEGAPVQRDTAPYETVPHREVTPRGSRLGS